MMMMMMMMMNTESTDLTRKQIFTYVKEINLFAKLLTILAVH